MRKMKMKMKKRKKWNKKPIDGDDKEGRRTNKHTPIGGDEARSDWLESEQLNSNTRLRIVTSHQTRNSVFGWISTVVLDLARLCRQLSYSTSLSPTLPLSHGFRAETELRGKKHSKNLGFIY